MIVISDKHGQLANRLFTFAHFLSLAIEHHIPLINLNFQEYSSFFYATNRNDFDGFPIRTRLTGQAWLDNFIARCLNKMVAALWYVKRKGKMYEILRIQQSHDAIQQPFSLRDGAFVESAQQKKVFVQGWLFRDDVGFKNNSDTIRKLLRPEEHYAKNVTTLMAEIRSSHEVVIGVHLRRGDYKNWQGGKYYYENETYVKRMGEIQAWLSQRNKSAIFYLCSNEPIDLQDFDGFDVALGRGHFIEDLFTLAACDYIIGPPSTFSMWASYYGKTPLLHLEYEEQVFSQEDLKIC